MSSQTSVPKIVDIYKMPKERARINFNIRLFYDDLSWFLCFVSMIIFFICAFCVPTMPLIWQYRILVFLVISFLNLIIATIYMLYEGEIECLVTKQFQKLSTLLKRLVRAKG